jgi:uncharacterized repeat protein (TIGR01451 family)
MIRNAVCAGLFLFLGSAILIAQDDVGSPAQGYQLEAQFLEYDRGSDTLVFRAVIDGKAWRYRLPIASDARIRGSDKNASLNRLEEGAKIRVIYRKRSGQNVVTDVTAVESAGNAPAEKPDANVDKGQQAQNADPRALGSLSYPTGVRSTSVVAVDVYGPEKIRVGQEQDFRLRVTNLTKNLTLQNVAISYDLPDSVRVYRVSDSEDAGLKSAGKKAGEDKKGTKQSNKASKTTSSQGSSDSAKGTEDSSQQHRRLGIGKLEPGNSRTIRLKVSGHEAGSMAGCLGVHYTPALCVKTEFVKPELELVKEAPGQANACEAIAVRYKITNNGTAAARGVVIRDELPSWVSLGAGTGDPEPKKEVKKNDKTKTAKKKSEDSDKKAGAKDEGAKKSPNEDSKKATARFDVGDLEPGQSREFTTKLHANKGGKIAGAAFATTENDLTVRSRETTTQVRQVKLKTEISGPDAAYVNNPANYTITVKNEGDAKAQNVRLRVRIGDKARFVRLRTSEGKNENAKEGPDSKMSGDKDADTLPAAQQAEDGSLLWNLGELKADGSRKVRLTLIGRSKGSLAVNAEAESECDRDIDSAADKAKTVTELKVLPALRFSLVDNSDPVKVGGTTRYTVSVFNQGTGPDHNVKVSVQLPKELEFLKATGESDAQANGQTIKLGPIGELLPGERATWQLQVRGKEEGDVRTRAELSSDYLGSPVPSVEPTRILK